MGPYGFIKLVLALYQVKPEYENIIHMRTEILVRCEAVSTCKYHKEQKDLAGYSDHTFPRVTLIYNYKTDLFFSLLLPSILISVSSVKKIIMIQQMRWHSRNQEMRQYTYMDKDKHNIHHSFEYLKIIRYSCNVDKIFEKNHMDEVHFQHIQYRFKS